MTDHLILITCWGPRACTQSSAVLLSHSVAKYYSLLAYTWIRLKINPQVPGSVSNRHGIECGPKLTKAVGQKWRFRAKVTHCTFDNTHIFTTTHTHTHFTCRCDQYLGSVWLPSEGRSFGKQVTHWNMQTGCPLVYQQYSPEAMRKKRAETDVSFTSASQIICYTS